MPRGQHAKSRTRDGRGRFGSKSASKYDGANPVARSSRSDVFGNSITGLARHNSKTSCDRWQHEFEQPQQVIENQYAFRKLIQRIVTREPRDAMRKGYTVVGLNEEQQRANTAFNLRRDFNAKFTTMRELARKTGLAALVMDIDDGLPMEEPVNLNSVNRLGELTVVDRWDLSVVDYSSSLELGELHAPTGYTIIPMQNVVVHPSRMLVMRGGDLTSREVRDRGGSGVSVIDSMQESLQSFFTTHAYLREAVTRITQGVFKSSSLEGGATGCDVDKVQRRMDDMATWMSILGDIALVGDETYEIINRGVTGFDTAADLFTNQLVMDTDLPKSLLTGLSPGGLNTGDNAGDWQSWTSFLGGEQIRIYNAPIRQYQTITFAATNGPVPASQLPENWTIGWENLFEPNAVEASTAALNYATAAEIVIRTRMMSPAEARTNPILQAAFPPIEGTEVSEDVDPFLTEPDDATLALLAVDEDDESEVA